MDRPRYLEYRGQSRFGLEDCLGLRGLALKLLPDELGSTIRDCAPRSSDCVGGNGLAALPALERTVKNLSGYLAQSRLDLEVRVDLRGLVLEALADSPLL